MIALDAIAGGIVGGDCSMITVLLGPISYYYIPIVYYDVRS